MKIDLHRMTIVWKMTLNSLEELKYTNGAFDTLEMLIIRLCYVLGQCTNTTFTPLIRHPEQSFGAAQALRRTQANHNTLCEQDNIAIAPRGVEQKINDDMISLGPSPSHAPHVIAQDDGYKIHTFKDLLELFRKHKELVLYHQLMDDVRVASFEQGKIEAKLSSMLPKNFTQTVVIKLEQWTGIKWQIVPVNVAEPLLSTREQDMENVKQSSLVRGVLEAFPGAMIKDIVKTG
jgi:hypothetical protein